MSGHSKWSTIKRKKGALDAKRGKIFTKIAREIIVAARQGGGDPSANHRLRAALAAAKAANMPRDNQMRAIKKGTGEGGGAELIEATYEARGPKNSTFILEVMTDNKNRTVAEIRSMFSKAGGELVSNGAVSYQYDRKGVVEFARSAIEEDDLMERAIEAGAEDVKDAGETWIVLAEPADLKSVMDALTEFEPTTAVRYLTKPEYEQALTGVNAVTVAKLWAKLDEHDDVQTCYCNASLPDDVMEEHGP